MIALIDADIVTYRVGFTTQEEEEHIAAYRVDELLFGILEEVGAEEYKCFLTSTDKSNFRFELYPDYKGNRKQPKPIHYDFIRKYLNERHDAEIIHGEEADDALGYSQTEGTVICSIDKDLLMIPGKHYNFVKKELYTITPEQGRYNFYSQLLLGDAGDNIPGCPGIGKATIPKLIHVDMSEEELFLTCLNTYKKQYEKKDIEYYETDMLRNGRLLKIKQTKDELLWEFPFVD